MKPVYARRALLLLLVVASGCAVVFPEEFGPTDQILASRYVTDEQRAATAALNSPEMNAWAATHEREMAAAHEAWLRAPRGTQ